MDMLCVQNAGFSYQAENGEVEAFRDVNFSVPRGKFVSIVGPSGCGKSTLLSWIAGLLPRTVGTVTINNKLVQGVSPHIGYMLQRDNLLEWRTIWDNVLFGLEIHHAISDETKDRAKHLLETYGLYDFRHKYPRQLSGGMRQRVALIRTLAAGPDILLLDEAFSALDFQTRLSVTDDVYRILRAENVTMLMVTHDIPEAVAMGDSVLILSQRPSTVKEVYPICFEEDHTPLSCRSDPRISQYFSHIWEALRENEASTPS